VHRRGPRIEEVCPCEARLSNLSNLEPRHHRVLGRDGRVEFGGDAFETGGDEIGVVGAFAEMRGDDALESRSLQFREQALGLGVAEMAPRPADAPAQ